jgi:putative aldouronate transport system substrate-binding protein
LGLTWEVKSDGTYSKKPIPEGFSGDWGWSYALNDFAPGYTSDKVSDLIDDLDVAQQYEDKKLLSAYYPKEYYPPVPMTDEELNELAILRTDIHNTAKTQFAQWIVNGGVEREYAGFVRQLETMGLRRMEQIYQNAYNRYMSK